MADEGSLSEAKCNQLEGIDEVEIRNFKEKSGLESELFFSSSVLSLSEVQPNTTNKTLEIQSPRARKQAKVEQPPANSCLFA